MGTPFALDFGAVMAVGQARGIDVEMLADVLPAADRAVIAGLSDSPGGDEGEDVNGT